MSPFRRLWNLTRRNHLDEELREEVDSHLTFIEDEARASGATEGDARRLARERFGSPLVHREQALDTVIMTSVESAWKETAFAARRLLRSPAFTLAAVLTLALAIGANAAIFCVVERVLLNPLPYPDSDRLIDLDHSSQLLNMTTGMGITRGYYYQYLERAHTLEGIALYASGDETITGDGEPQRIRVTRATTSLAAVMRVWPEVGRWFTEDEGKPGAPARAVLSHGLWMRRYGGDPGIVGRSITLSGVRADVIGVLSASSSALCGWCLVPSVWCCSSPAPTSRTCFSCDPRPANARLASALRSERVVPASRGISSPRACCCRWWAAQSALPWPGAASGCSCRPGRRRFRGFARFAWTVSR